MIAMTAAIFVWLILLGLAVGFLIWGRRYREVDEAEFQLAQLQHKINQVQSQKAQLRQRLRITD